MKRPPRSFVVEVRRQKRPSNEAAPSWTEEALKSTRPGAERPTRPAEPAPAPAPAAAAPSEPPPRTGRILPSLVEAPPPAPAAKAPKPAKARAPRRGRPPAPAPAPAAYAFVAPKPVVPPPTAEPSAEPQRPSDSARHRRILARYVFGGAQKPGDRWKRRLRGDKR